MFIILIVRHQEARVFARLSCPRPASFILVQEPSHVDVLLLPVSDVQSQVEVHIAIASQISNEDLCWVCELVQRPGSGLVQAITILIYSLYRVTCSIEAGRPREFLYGYFNAAGVK